MIYVSQSLACRDVLFSVAYAGPIFVCPLIASRTGTPIKFCALDWF